jgi:pyridoxamine 5'-phosphate oxidase
MSIEIDDTGPRLTISIGCYRLSDYYRSTGLKEFILGKQEIIEFLSKNPLCFLATADGDTPHVRGIMTYRTDENGTIFHTGATKDLHKQIQKNPQAEMCFFDNASGVQVRINGKLEIVDDLELKQEIVSKRPFLKPMVDDKGWEFLVLYRLSHGMATIWTMATNLDPKIYVQL